jgi:hypothetical protein
MDDFPFFIGVILKNIEINNLANLYELMSIYCKCQLIRSSSFFFIKNEKPNNQSFDFFFLVINFEYNLNNILDYCNII